MIDQHILHIIQEELVTDQAELLQKLTDQGIKITQSTLSRHLRKLGIHKEYGRYVVVARKAASSRIIRMTASPPNIVVLHTLPGHAQAIAYELDQHTISEIAGTLAGDDVIIVAVRTPEYLEKVKIIIQEILGGPAL